MAVSKFEEMLLGLKRFCLILARGDQDKAQDVMSEAVENFYKRLRNKEQPLRISADKVLPYLIRIAVNVRNAHGRRCLKEGPLDQLVSEIHLTVIDGPESIDHEVWRDEFWQSVRCSLTEVEFQSVQLHYKIGLTVRELAQVLGVSERTIKHRLATARRRLHNKRFRNWL